MNLSIKLSVVFFCAMTFLCGYMSASAYDGHDKPLSPVVLNMEDLDYYIGTIKDSPEKHDDWQHVTEFDFGELKGNHDVWLKIPVPENLGDNTAILITAFLNGMDIYCGNTKIYSYGNMTSTAISDFKYHTSHIIPYDSQSCKNTLYLNSVYLSRAGFGEIFSLAAGDTSKLSTFMISERDELYKSSIIDVCLGFLLLVVSAASLFVFIIRWKERNFPFLSFGMFALFVGMTYLSDSTALFYLNHSPESHYYMKTFSFLMVPAGLFSFFSTMFYLGRNASIVVNCLWIFHCFLGVAGILYIDYSIDYALYFPVILIINCTICIIMILLSGQSAALNIRITFIAFFMLFITLTLFYLMELLNYIPFTYDIFGWGLIVFVFALGYVLVQHYTSTFYTMQNVSLELEKNKSELLELQKENLVSQLEALKNQIDPHFLFNSFSTLSSIIEDNQDTAVNFVQELSSVYRYVLQTRINTLVTLKEELDFIDSYRFLMSSRFGENLSIAISISDSLLHFHVMPFSLQLLVENAIKHNIISGKKPLFISISEQNGYLIVSNTLQKKKTPLQSTHIGLENIKKRYGMITEKEVRIVETESEFIVEIPLVGNINIPDGQ